MYAIYSLNDGYFIFFALALRVLNRIDATSITSEISALDSLCKNKTKTLHHQQQQR